MSAIDNAKNHFKNREMVETIVPEWGDESGPLVIYSDPINLAEKNRIYKRGEKDKLESLAFAIILKAKDAEGEKLFTVKDLHDLTHDVDPNIVARVAYRLMEVEDDGNIEDIKKK